MRKSILDKALMITYVVGAGILLATVLELGHVILDAVRMVRQ